MTVTIDEEEVRKEYRNRKIRNKVFDDRVKIHKVKGFELIDCTFKYDRGDDEVLLLENCEDITLKDCHFPKKERNTSDVVMLIDCKDIRLEVCDFQGKTKKGNFVDIKGNETFDIRIDHCEFNNHTHPANGNGGEAILIGRGDNGGRRSFKTVVTGCTFNRCNGDVEIISIKQSETEIIDNTFENWEVGNVSIRFGNSNKIKKNEFKGSGGGIVVRGRKNEIIDNTHIGNNNRERDDDYRPLTIECGSSNGEYAQAIDNTIADNTYENCRGPCIVLGQEDRPKKPKDNKFRNNTLIANDVDSTFLIVPDHIGDNRDKERLRDANTYRNNELRGRHARPGILLKGAFK